MRLFVCLLDPNGRGISETVRLAYEGPLKAHDLTPKWQSIDHAAILTSDADVQEAPPVARDGPWFAVGFVRLDNRADLERWSECKGGQLSDLELVLRTVAQHGTKYVAQFLGDFAFVIWNPVSRSAVAACDAFRVKKLYYAERGGLLAFASRADMLALDERYDVRFLAERVAGCASSPGLSVFDGVKPVPAGAMALLDLGRLTIRPYWSPNSVQPEPSRTMSEHEAAGTLRQLLAEAVRLRLGSTGQAWSQLSGGLDSSSVASVAQWLLERGEVTHGLVGTVTYVDRQGTGADEREYSDAVVSRWRLHNETIVDPPMWHDARYPTPRADHPRYSLMFYPRECRLCEIVRTARGGVLLTGQGADEFLRGNMFFFADWLARGRIRSAGREMLRRAALGRVSFWGLAYRNAVLPLLPRAMQLWLARDEAQLPPWIHPAVVRKHELDTIAFETLLYAGRIGHKYHDAITTCLTEVGRTIGYVVLEDMLDVRHPFLYRPLVEFGLRLPPELVVQPHARKWILREAMRGLLPEAVRTRVGKGTPAERHAWSLATQRPLLEPLVRESMLADLGVVDAVKLRAAFDAAPREPQRRGDPHGALQGVLAIEAWLQMRTGRWPRGGRISAKSTEQVYHPSA